MHGGMGCIGVSRVVIEQSEPYGLIMHVLNDSCVK